MWFVLSMKVSRSETKMLVPVQMIEGRNSCIWFEISTNNIRSPITNGKLAWCNWLHTLPRVKKIHEMTN
jgi:hypothetical protein